METIKSGGSSTFIDIEKSAATTPCNPLFIGIPERRVVAVVAELQNSVEGFFLSFFEHYSSVYFPSSKILHVVYKQLTQTCYKYDFFV